MLKYLVNEGNIKEEDKAIMHDKIKDWTEKKNKTTKKNEAIKEKHEEKSKKAIITLEQSMGIAKINKANVNFLKVYFVCHAILELLL